MVDGAEGLPSVERDGDEADAGFISIKIGDDITISVIIKVKLSRQSVPVVRLMFLLNVVLSYNMTGLVNPTYLRLETLLTQISLRF
jgi:hypothetical protein